MDWNSITAETPQKQDDRGGQALNRYEIRDYIFLILKVKDTSLTTHLQKGSLEVRKQRGVTAKEVMATTHRPLHWDPSWLRDVQIHMEDPEINQTTDSEPGKARPEQTPKKCCINVIHTPTRVGLSLSACLCVYSLALYSFSS